MYYLYFQGRSSEASEDEAYASILRVHSETMDAGADGFEEFIASVFLLDNAASGGRR
jgi:hypothetical protein